jgi:acyl dehydratase
VISVGQALPELEVSVGAEPMKPMALLLRDPNPIHLDPAVVAGLGLGDRVINQGPLNTAYLWEMLSRWLGDSARVRTLRVRFTSNAYAGDRVRAGGHVASIAGGLATCAVWLRTDEGRDVLTGTAFVRLTDEETS